MENDNHVGETYGIYTLIEFLNEKDKYGHYLYKGKCKVCGYEITKPFNHFSASSAITNNCKHLDKITMDRIEFLFKKRFEDCLDYDGCWECIHVNECHKELRGKQYE